MHRKIFAAILLCTASAALGPAACSPHSSHVAGQGAQAGIDAAAIDKTVRPGDDFYAFANGGWMKSTEIPADRSSIGGFYIADHETEKRLGELVNGIIKSNAAADSDEGRIKTFYTAYMNQAGIDAAGLAPIKPDLDRFAAIDDVKALSRVLGEQLRADVDPFNATDYKTENLLGLFVTQALDGKGVVPYLLQGGLGLPEREYYISGDANMAAMRAKYRAYIEQILTDAGMSDAPARAQRIFELETKIARVHATRAQSEDFAASSAVWSRADFPAKAPGIDWDAFFGAAGLGSQQTFAAYHATAMPGLSALVASEPLDTWEDWLAFHQISTNADVLPAKFDQARFAFYGAALTGAKQQRPRDQRALDALDDALGDAVGKLYTARYFPAADRQDVQAMVGEIKSAFARRVEGITWMAVSTKREALEKVRTIEVGVGYPDSWRDYAGLKLLADNAYANKQAGQKLYYAQQLAKIGKPMDRREWWMNAQLVNAVNLPLQNALNFPAGILQRPFYDPAADKAFNYGAVGAVIGHEISHSFDNNGAAFDASGKMRNWWTDTDRARFDAAGKALAEQYDAYSPFPGVHVNGKLTLGENIADVAGLSAAYDAYRASLHGKEAPVIGGYTGDQRFFLAFAQSWATKMREEALRARIATDGHSPGMYRALTVRNLDAWYRAFDVKPGDRLYLPPEQRVKVW